MPGKPFMLGPFIGGLNTSSDAASISDKELVTCTNLELDLDGALVSRPPIVGVAGEGDWTERIRMIGTVEIGGDTYLIGATDGTTWHFTGGVWTELTDTMATAAVLQYNDVAYLLPEPGHSTIALGKWTPSGGFSAVNNANLKTMMSGGTDYGGNGLAIYKGRLFICPGPGKSDNTSRLIFSDPGDPETYSATTQFIDVNPGDGQILMDMIVHEDNLVLFKDDSTWVLTFTSSPSDAELLALNKDVGVSSSRCIIPFENNIYILHRSRVYEIRNYNFQCINIRVPLVLDATTPSTRSESIIFSRFGERLIVRYGNNIYTYGFRTKTWSMWKSADSGLHNFGDLVHYLTSTEDLYYAGSCLTADTSVFTIRESLASNIVEENDGDEVSIMCVLKTKNFDFDLPYKYKRMHWWGADLRSPNAVTGIVDPVIFSFQPTWEMLANQEKAWQDLLTWGQTLSTAVIIDTITSTGTGTARRFLKFPKSVRFRQISFQLEMETDGSSTEAPIKVYTLTFIGNEKAFVVKDVN